MKIGIARISCVLLALSLLPNCASNLPNLLIESLDKSLQFAYVSSFGTLNLMSGDGSDARELVEVSGQIVSPQWSPDGQKIAYFDIETGIILLRSREVRLCYYDLETQEVRELMEVSAVVERRPNRPRLYDLPPPIWLDNDLLFVQDREGIHSIDVGTARSVLIVESSRVHCFDLMEDSDKLLVSIDGGLITYDLQTGESDKFFDEENSSGSAIDGKIDCIKVSPSERRIAAGEWKGLFLIDCDDRSTEARVELPGPIDDIIWYPDGQKLVCLTGTADRGTIRGTANPTGTALGSFQVSAASLDEVHPTVLYKKLNFDVRDTRVSISPDGKWILLVSNDLNDKRKCVYIIPSTGGGIRKLTSKGEFGFPIWRP